MVKTCKDIYFIEIWNKIYGNLIIFKNLTVFLFHYMERLLFKKGCLVVLGFTRYRQYFSHVRRQEWTQCLKNSLNPFIF